MKGRIWTYFLCCTTFFCCGWGFFGHRHINELAVYTLPAEMISLYKSKIDYIRERSTAPDQRRYAVKGEAPRHYIDLDLYTRGGADSIPRRWDEAVTRYGMDTLEDRGILPWHIYRMYRRLKAAFMVRDPDDILRISAELGHYVADAQVPLHTTHNYNGQLTGQEGIHALWESRLPSLFFDEYDFFVGRASYVDDVQARAWQAVSRAHRAVDSVLRIEKRLAKRWGDKKYGFEATGRQTVKVVSREYAARYHKRLNGMVERQMRAGVKMVGDLWYTAWVDAGQPELNSLVGYTLTAEERERQKREVKEWQKRNIKTRRHEGGGR